MQTELKNFYSVLALRTLFWHPPRQSRGCHLPTGSPQRPAIGFFFFFLMVEKGGIKVTRPEGSLSSLLHPGPRRGGHRAGWARHLWACGCAGQLAQRDRCSVPPTHTHPGPAGLRGAWRAAPSAVASSPGKWGGGPASPRARARAHPRAPSCRGNGAPPPPTPTPGDRAEPRPRGPPAPPPRGRPRRDLRHSAARGREPERRMEQERNLPM